MKVLTSNETATPNIISRIFSIIKRFFKSEELSTDDKERKKKLEKELHGWGHAIKD